MFENIRRSLEELLAGATRPEERHMVVARMKDTLVHARVSLDEVREAMSYAQKKLAVEQRELETVRRRKSLAEGVKDVETITIAEKFEKQHTDRISVLEQKIAAMTQELALAEREYEEMKAELKAAMRGVPGAPPAGNAPLGTPDEEDPLGESQAAKDAGLKNEIDSLARERARADRAADVDKKLEELKKSMGK